MLTGIDIGGTKCAVIAGSADGVADKIKFETATVDETIKKIISGIEKLGANDAIGISCGIGCCRGYGGKGKR